MDFVADCVRYLANANRWTYCSEASSASEPAALCALALAAHGNGASAIAPARWLAEIQTASGAVGVSADQATPAWPTSLAILAWLAVATSELDHTFDESIRRAIGWILNDYGKSGPSDPKVVGHDSTLRGWSWAANTHSWMEPTCMAVLALKAVGQSDHPRTREAVQLLVDRLLPSGGSNYGNTFVLGQATLPLVESTGLAMLALADEQNSDPRIEKSLTYLKQQLGPETATASLCYGLLGLTAHRRRPTAAESWLRQVWLRESQVGTNSFKASLILLASLPDPSWLPGDSVSDAQGVNA